MTETELFKFLDKKVDFYNRPSYLADDPLQIPHRFDLKQDVEISAFLAATIAWGVRKSIISDTEKMLSFMGNSPYDFVMSAKKKDFEKLIGTSIHRTFNGEDFMTFVLNLQRLYQKSESLSTYFQIKPEESNYYEPLHRFREVFLLDKNQRSQKHISSTYRNSAAKRLLMFLRWMVRKDSRGVDLGIWNAELDQSKLSCPLDVHSGRIARSLGILYRKQNDWKAVEELDVVLRKYRPDDPSVYDYALFGIGVNHDLNSDFVHKIG